MSLAQRSPRSRKSLNSTQSASTLDASQSTSTLSAGSHPNQSLLAKLEAGGRPKGRAASVGGAELALHGVRPRAGGGGLSPKKAARRALAPRKSILKSANSEETTNFTKGYYDPSAGDEDDTMFRGPPGETTTMRFKNRVSFAAHAHVRMFEVEDLNRSSSHRDRPGPSFAPPPLPSPAPSIAPALSFSGNIFEDPTPIPSTSGITTSSLLPPSSSLNVPSSSRRKSTTAINPARRTSSAGTNSNPPTATASTYSGKRRASVQPTPVTAAASPADIFRLTPTAISTSSALPASQSAPSSRRRSSPGSNRRSSAVSEGSVDMDLDSDQDDEEERNIFQSDQQRTREDDRAAEGDEEEGEEGEEEDEEEEEEMMMDETQVLGGILANAHPAAINDPRFSPSASTASPHASPSRGPSFDASANPPPTSSSLSPAPSDEIQGNVEEEEEDDSDDLSESDDDPEDKTMDFTVATGGIIPPSAPEGIEARSNRPSIGYAIEEAEAKRLFAWNTTAVPTSPSSLPRGTTTSVGHSLGGGGQPMSARERAELEELGEWGDEREGGGGEGEGAGEEEEEEEGEVKGEETMEMEMTGVVGGILHDRGGDEGESDLSTELGEGDEEADEGDEMDMDETMAYGGVVLGGGGSVQASGRASMGRGRVSLGGGRGRASLGGDGGKGKGRASLAVPPSAASRRSSLAAARRASLAASRDVQAKEGEDREEADDETMALDLTAPHGGIYVGPEDHLLLKGEGEGEEEEAMDEETMAFELTEAHGGILGGPRAQPDNAIEDAGREEDDDDEEGEEGEDGTMAIDFTVAQGGIYSNLPSMNLPSISSPLPTSSSDQHPSHVGSTEASHPPPPPKSPRRATAAPPTPTRPIPSSISRPTASSAAKTRNPSNPPTPSNNPPTPREKNLFDSPAKSLVPTPSKGGEGSSKKKAGGRQSLPAAAADASRSLLGSAKKLFFGSRGGEGEGPGLLGKKRGADDDEVGEGGGDGEGGSLFSTKSPKKRRSSAAAAAPSTATSPSPALPTVEIEDVFGSLVPAAPNTNARPGEPPVQPIGRNIFGPSSQESIAAAALAFAFASPRSAPSSPNKKTASPSKKKRQSLLPSRQTAEDPPLTNIFAHPSSPAAPPPSAFASASEVAIDASVVDPAPPPARRVSTFNLFASSTPPDAPPTPPAPEAVFSTTGSTTQNLFASDSIFPLDFSAEEPAASIITPASRATPKKKLGRMSVAAAMTPRAVAAAERSSYGKNGMMEDEMMQPNPVTLGQFLDMTGLTFMDKMHPRRRSTINPGELLGIHRRDVTGSTSNSGREYQTVEYANHVLNVPYLMVYQWACNHLKESTALSQHNVHILDQEASTNNPVLFREYLEAEDEEKGMIEAQLKYLKAYSHLTIKKKWRDWRLDLILKLKAIHEEDLTDLNEDREKLAEIQTAFDQSAPLDDLRARHAALKTQLAQERAKVEEVLACDQQELSHRRSDIQEQKDQIDSLKADLADTNVMLGSLTNKYDTLEAQRKSIQDAIDRANSVLTDSLGFTREKVFRLKDQFDALENLSSIKITSIRADALELTILDDLKLSLICDKYKPTVKEPRLELVRPLGKRTMTEDGELLEYLFQLVEAEMRKFDGKDVKELVSLVNHMWSSVLRINLELRLISLRYPTSYQLLFPSSSISAASSEPTLFQARAFVLIPSIRTKMAVSFSIDGSTLRSWPASVNKLDVELKIVYGNVKLLSTMQAKLAEATVERHGGLLVDSILDAVSASD